MSEEYTGGSVRYYSIDVTHPLNQESGPYTAECQDIIEALGLDFQEGNVLKAVWRRAAARLGKSKKGYTDGLYDAEKIVFYGQRLVDLEERERRVAGAVQRKLDFAPTPPPRDELVLVEGLDLPVTKTWADNVGADIKPGPFGPRDADGWYTWNGDDTMRPAGRVDFIMRDGEQEQAHAADLEWNHGPDSGDIVKWRPAQEQSK